MTALGRTLARKQQRASHSHLRIGQAHARGGFPSGRSTPGALASPPPVHFPSDPNSIVTVDVKTILAPTPNTYQQTGALVTFGGTLMKAGEVQELTMRSDLDLVSTPALQIESLTWGIDGNVTATVIGEMSPDMQAGRGYFSISGCVPEDFNAHHVNITSVGPASFTYTTPALQTDPGPALEFGTVQGEAAIELGQMATTFFDQGNSISVYVLELGSETDNFMRAAQLEKWLQINPRSFYGYLLPRSIGTSEEKIKAFDNVFKQYQNPEAMTYFWLTVDKEEINILDETYKCIIQFVEAPSVVETLNLADPFGEFSCAAMFYNAMVYKPSSALRIAPMSFKFLYGVTRYPTQNNGPLLSGFKKSSTNYVSSGAEGGIAYDMVYTGITKDGMDYFNWWYTIDFVQIQINIDLSNAIINGSNNALAPLYYDQTGIDVLCGTLASTMANCRAFGMVVGAIMTSSLTGDQLQTAIDAGSYEGVCNCNAVPFIPYAQSNPSHYRIGEYDGLSTLFIPKRGFIHILVTVSASQLVVI